MIQFTDANLDAALAPGQVRTIRPLLQIDWLKNDTFVSPASQLTSDNLIQVDCVDDVDSGLPAEVNGRPTASSTTLTAVLHGYVDDLPLWKLFSAWNRESPYHGLTLEGSAVKFDVNTATAGGSTATRRFTGWVDSVQVDRVDGTVTVVAKNNLHLLGHTVSLPRWARGTNVFDGLPHVTGWDIPTEDRMENAPLTVAYLIQNILRQCKAVPGPDPRADSIWFSSAYGGLIPEKGMLTERSATCSAMSQGISSYVFPQNWGFPNYNRDILSFGELGFPSPYHSADSASGSSGDIFDTYSQSAATVEVWPTSGQPRYLNGGVWARIPSGDSGSFVDQTLFLDPAGTGVEADRAKVRLVVGASNTTLTIRDTLAGNLRTLTVATPTTKDTLIYVSWEMDFAAPGNMRIWYNNVQQTGSLTGTLTGYPTTRAGYLGNGRYFSQGRVWARHAGWVNGEFWLNNTAQVGSTRVQSWANQSYMRKDFAFINGGIPGAQVLQSDFRNFENYAQGSGTMPCVTHIPYRRNVDAWELLKEICAAFHLSMWIDAYGGLRIVTQGVLSILEQRLTDPRKDLDGDSLQGIKLASNFDAVRDRVTYSGRSARTGWSSAIYQPAAARQFTADAGQSATYRIPFPPDAISVSAYQFLLATRYYNEKVGEWVGAYNCGFKATQENGDAGTLGVAWPVTVQTTAPGGVTDEYFEIRIVNSHTQRIFLADATQASPGSGDIQNPAFLMPGKNKTYDEVELYSQGSGDRLLQIPLSDFHSAAWTMNKTIAALLYRASQNVPRAEDLTLPGDPRREVYDMINLHDPDGGLAVAISQIIGRADTWSSGDGYTQRLSVRLVYPPDSWLMEIDGFTEADQTTYFG